MQIDNFALTMFQACPAKFMLRIKEGYTSRRKSAALGFGGSFHAGLAEWYRTGSKVAMLKAVEDTWPDGMPSDDYRTKQKCVETLLAYVKEYPAETFKVIQLPSGPLIEQSFTLPTGMFLPCELCWHNDRSEPTDTNCANCGAPKEPIEYGGILDGGVEFSGSVFTLEHKTTSQLGSTFFYQFRPNNQVSGYTWALGLLTGQRVGGTLINAVGVYKSSAPKFERQITVRSDEELTEWMHSVYKTCVAIRECERTGEWPLFTVACTMYGRCEFHPVHVLPHARQREAVLEQDYVRNHWSYEGRDDAE